MSQRKPSIGESQKYWRAPGNRRIRRGRYLRQVGRLTLLISLQVLIGLAVCVGVLKLFDNLTSGPQFDLTKIRLEGVERSDRAELETVLQSALGNNLLHLDLRVLSGRLAARPWVRTAGLRRVLPSTLRVTIEERRPGAIALIQGIFHLVDREGVVLGPLSPEMHDNLPVLLGMPEEPMALKSALLNGVRQLRRLENETPALYHELSELDYSKSDRIVARLRTNGPELYLDPYRVERNLDRYLALRSQIEQAVGYPRYVDLRWRDRIAVLPANAS